MKNRDVILLLLCFALFTIGCATAKYPIDATPLIKLDNRLIGKWKTVVEGHGKDIYTITAKDEYNYKISFKDRGSKKTEVCTAYLSDLDNVKFMNVCFKEDSIVNYFFLRLLDIKSDDITVATVGDTTLKMMTNAQEVRGFFLKNLHKPPFYDDTVHFRRIK